MVECDPECEDIPSRHDLMYFETRRWTRRAEWVHVGVSDIPLPDGVESHWKTTYDGFGYLPYDTLRKLKRLVIDAEYEETRRKREGRELWVKYFTAVAATVAAAASLLNLYFTYQKK